MYRYQTDIEVTNCNLVQCNSPKMKNDYSGITPNIIMPALSFSKLVSFLWPKGVSCP